MTKQFAGLGLPILLIAGSCRSPSAVAAQEAAVRFMLNQPARAQGVCISIAVGPGDRDQELVIRNLADPSPEFLARVSATGLDVRPLSACRPQGRPETVLKVGWPVPTPDGFDVPVDMLCGPVGCDHGYVVQIKETPAGLRGVGARTTWVS
jgi:hypothetical protein